jgi:hypothetical protein
MAEPGTEEKEGILPFLGVRAIKPHAKEHNRCTDIPYVPKYW